MPNSEKQLKIFKLSTFFLFVVVLIGFIIFFKSKSSATSKQNLDVLTEKAKPIAETTIGRDFNFLVKKGGKESFKIILEKATLVKLVTNKGKPLVSRDKESFLLVYLMIENELTSGLTITSQNYVRLIDKDGKKFAPDFYNVSVKVSAISSKKDQIGFVVKENQKIFNLLVGEIDGKKELVEVKFN